MSQLPYANDSFNYLMQISKNNYSHLFALQITWSLFGLAVAKKRLNEEKKLNEGLSKYTTLQQQHVHQKEEVS